MHPILLLHSLRGAALSLALGLSLSACATADRVVTGSTTPTDYRARHPIVLAESTRSLDVFMGRGGAALDKRQALDVRAFGADYAASGHGGIQAMVPSNAYDARRSLEAVSRVLVASGARGGIGAVGSYVPDDPGLAAPIRLTFRTTRAKVASRCGLWPGDLGPGPTWKGWGNEPYWNLGCSTQTALAEQVADPLDLVRPRAEGEIDTKRRTNVIGKLRDAKDPSTEWREKFGKIKDEVGK